MAVHDKTTRILHELVFNERPPRVTVDGPQAGVIASVSGSSCYVTIPALSADFKYGPAPFLPGLTLDAGDDCLVVFVGNGVKTPWVVGGGALPAPPTAPVTSVFGRTGGVAAASGDYTAAEVTGAADKSSSSTQSFTGAVQAPELAATATGTTGRYVGVTSGSPTGGPYNTGDFANDPTHGVIWQCTAGGSPGTWKQLGANDGNVPVGGLVATATNSAFNSTGTIFTTSVPVVAGHVYEVSLAAFATQETSASTSSFIGVSAGSGTLAPAIFRAFSEPLSANQGTIGTVVGTFTPASTGNVTLTVTASTTAGTLNSGAGGCLLLVTLLS